MQYFFMALKFCSTPDFYGVQVQKITELIIRQKPSNFLGAHQQRIRSNPGALFAFIPVGNDTFLRMFFLILEHFSNQKAIKVEYFSIFFKNLTKK